MFFILFFLKFSKNNFFYIMNFKIECKKEILITARKKELKTHIQKSKIKFHEILK